MTKAAGKIDIKELQQYIPFVSIGIILLGILNLIFYFQKFGINVLEFVEVGEVLISFLNIGLPILISLLIIIFFASLSDLGFLKLKVNWWFSLFVVLLLVILGMAETWPFVYRITTSSTPGVKYIFAFLFVFMAIVFWVNSDSVNEGICWALIVLGSFLYFSASEDVYDVRANKRYVGTIIILKNGDSLKSDSSCYYVGNTKNYYFFYDEIKRQPHAIPRLEVAKFILPQRKLSPKELRYYESRTKNRAK